MKSLGEPFDELAHDVQFSQLLIGSCRLDYLHVPYVLVFSFRIAH
jgi:hypothetical protein